MNQRNLAISYMKKANVRFQMLEFLLSKEAFSDVIREAQEVVELVTKAMLRLRGIDPPKFHDVSFLFIEHKESFPEIGEDEIERLVRISKKLRKERELAFYGDIDFIPTEEYTNEDAKFAIEETKFVIELAYRLLSE
ncbi:MULTISPECIES: HEPN domain-containing protein [Thermodesulfovibrio]|jgi:HEPN domain-containing protein|uniref:HEPN domain-containing protein n=1 Tax=Thermodesulfovibrio TaxID=28261 RepID=UPI002605BDCD|nr:HEPN domain-containing protein [Thermodesulfovibrio sp.]